MVLSNYFYLIIVICFYIMLNLPYWFLLLKKRKKEDLKLQKVFHQWVYDSDDLLNKILNESWLLSSWVMVISPSPKRLCQN